MKHFFAFCLFLSIAACTSPKRDFTGVNIVFYGLTNCSICASTREELDDEGIPYTFVSVDKGQNESRKEMETKVRAIFPEGAINMPVLEVNGKILIQPELSAVLEAAGK